MLIKRDKRDAVFSNLVRERANWTCERCAKFYPEGERRGLHCSHFVGRAVRATRWHSMNATALCLGCHEYFGQRPLEHVAFMQLRIGAEGVERLRRLSNTILRWRKADLEDIYQHLKSEHEMQLHVRKTGFTDEILFLGAEAFLPQQGSIFKELVGI